MVGIGLNCHHFITSLNTTMGYLHMAKPQRAHSLFHNLYIIQTLLDYYFKDVGSQKNHKRIQMDMTSCPLGTTITRTICF